jgi:hypothetical protein
MRVEREYFESNTTDINPKRLAVLIEDKTDFRLDGGGSEFIMHDRMQPITVDNSNGVNIENLSIDWEVPLTAEAQVTKVLENGFEIKIDASMFPYIIENGRIVFVGEGWKSRLGDFMEFDEQTKNVAFNTGDKGVLRGSWGRHKAEEIEKETIRLTKNDRQGGCLYLLCNPLRPRKHWLGF